MPDSKELKDLDSQLKKTVISADSFKKNSSFDLSKNLVNIHKNIGSLAGHTRKLAVRFINLEKVVDNNSIKITSLKNLSKSQSRRVSGENIGTKLPGGTTSGVEESISAIAKSVSSIAEILDSRKKLADATAENERKRAEKEKRGLAESKLEKVFSGIARTAEKIITPVKSLLDRVLQFIGTIILGRVLFKLIEWFSDSKNQEKVQSIIRFFKDHWPKLLSLYLVFGNSFGRFVFSLTKTLIGGAIKLGIAIAKLLAAKKVAGARGAAKFLGRAGRPIAAGLAAIATVGGAMALTNNLKGSDEQPKAQTFFGGGLAIPKFGGGGFNFKGMLGGAGMGAMFGPLGMLLGGALGGSSGFVSGEKGVDKVPAMLSDGEFVMSRGAVAKYGVDTLEAMNAAGGGTNKPKIVAGTTYAAGGGMIGNYDKQYSGGLISERKEELSQRNIIERLRRIEAQMQVQRALASGKGLDIKGAELGSEIGKGFSTTYMGREAIKVSIPPGGSFEKEITLAGKRYFAMKKGNDVIYVSNFARGLRGQTDKYGAANKTYGGIGGKLVGGYGLKDIDLPKTRIMTDEKGKPFVGYLTFLNGVPFYDRPKRREKGILENIINFFDPRGARYREETLNARSLRMAAIGDLESYRKTGMREENIKNMLNDRLGPNGYSRAVNDLKAKQARIKREAEIDKVASAAAFGTSGDGLNKPKVSNLGNNYKQQELKLAAAANKPRVKPVQPPVRPKPKPQTKPYTPAGGGMNGRRGSGGGSTPPQFSASRNSPAKMSLLGLLR